MIERADLDVEELIERERVASQWLAATEDLGTIGMLDTDATMDDARWSPGVWRLLGRPEGASAMTAEQWLAHVSPRSRTRVVEETAFAVDHPGSRVRYELERRDHHHRRRWLAVSLESYRTGTRTRLRGTISDTTTTRRWVLRNRALADVALLALSEYSDSSLMRSISTTMADRLETPLVSVRTLHPDGSEALVLRGRTGEPEPRFEPSQPLQPGTTPHWAATRRESLLVTDYATEPRVSRSTLLTELGVGSTVIAPILRPERVVGLLAAHSLAPGHFDDDDREFLTALAGVIAAGLERNRAERELERLATLRARLIADTLDAEERVRRTLSEQLHDSALQDLLASRQDLVEAQEAAALGVTEDLRQMMSHCLTGMDAAILQLRDAVHALHPVVLQHGGLDAALRAAGEQAARQGRFSFSLELDPETIGHCDELVLSVARELLTNAAKHAHATHVRVALVRTEPGLRLEVHDDGDGVDLGAVRAAPTAGHIGLFSLEHRLHAVGAEFGIAPAGERGTRAWASIPFATTADDDDADGDGSL